MMETAFPALRSNLQWMGCVTRTTGEENKIDSTATPYRAPALLSETVARTCTELILKECEIEELPELIGMYYLLRVLDVSDNKLMELPPDVGSCYSLQTLDFSSNMIKVIPDEIQQLPYLTKLHCYNNRIVTIPDWIGVLPLVEFNIYNNKVLHLTQGLGQLTDVSELNLACNVCMQISAEAMKGWGNVTILNLYDCRLVKMAGFGQLQSMEELRLFNNNLTELPNFDGKKMEKLRLLECSRNNIPNMPLQFFKALPVLEKLTLNNNLIETVPSGINCPKLEWLVLSDNKIQDIPPDTPLLPSLKVLLLNGNQLQSLPETFVRAKNLARVNLARNNKLTQTSMHLLVAIKKNCNNNNGQYWAPDTLA